MAGPIDCFPPGVAEKLSYYVYRLIDPRNGETFYVGKGRGNRLFAHIRDELKKMEVDEDDTKLKLKRIREIRNLTLEVGHVVHRHGMDEKTAFEVEAALIDAYPGLANEIGGAGNNDRGAMHVREIISLYDRPVAVFQHKALLINVNRSATEIPLYEAVRHSWKLNKENAEQAEVVLATRLGLIIGAFIPHRWLDATTENFPGRSTDKGRIGFEGEEAPQEIQKLYVGKRVPDEYRKKGASFQVHLEMTMSDIEKAKWVLGEAGLAFPSIPRNSPKHVRIPRNVV